MTGHGCSSAWVVEESKRLFPLDLPARVAWLVEMAHASTNEADRQEILRAVRLLRNGVTA